MSFPSSDERVAIIALGGHFPGASNLEEFWKNIAGGIDACQEVPPRRWSLPANETYAAGGPKPDKVLSTRGCFLSENRFDLEGLRLDRDVIERLDPVFGLTLSAGKRAWHAVNDEKLDLRRVGVILGNIVLPTVASSQLGEQLFSSIYEEQLFGSKSDVGSVPGLDRYVAGLPAGLLSRALGLGGGSMTLDAACASSLYAIELAVRELLAGRADAMLAGGVSRPDPLYTQMGFSQLHALSPSGRCAPFDAAADGLVVGEGAGIVVLKRLSDALRDGDAIHGVITAIGLSNDVDGNLLQPSSEGQLRALRAAYAKSGWSPEDIELIECHGTGTPVGDAVEFASLRALWGDSKAPRRRCVIGSVKSNVGHLLTGAGAAGLIKVLLALKHETLPPTANFRAPNPRLGLAESPFEVLSAPQPWERQGGARRAAINAFGFGGINAHLLLEEWTGRTRSQVVSPASPAKACDVAVVGMDARFGSLPSLQAFQEHVLSGTEALPCDNSKRWGPALAAVVTEQKIPLHALPDLEIPKGRFRIPPRELEEILPQQLLMLDVAMTALEDANIQADREARKRFGVFVGIGLDLNTTNFHFRWSLANKAKEWGARLGLLPKQIDEWAAALRDGASPALSANRTMGALGGIVASRIARELRVGGPSFTISSEETSGLKVLEAAVRALQAGEIDVAIVGAVDINGDPRSLFATSRDRAFSQSGTCRPFEESGGTVAGEGAAALVLRRLDDATADDNQVHAVVKGIGSASSTSTDLFTVDEEAYRDACTRAYEDAAIDRDSIGYVETHGSGTAAEDLPESRALSELFNGARELPFLGTVKPQIGHAGAASGLASLVKTILCLKHEVLPPFAPSKPMAGVDRFPVLRAPTYWLRNRIEGPRHAAVSGISIDGSCAHVVLAEPPLRKFPAKASAVPTGASIDPLFLVPGGDRTTLLAALEEFQRWAAGAGGESAEVLARNWWRQVRGRGPWHLALVARETDTLRHFVAEAIDQLSSESDRLAPPMTPRGGWCYSPRRLAENGQLAFVYPGSGSHFLGMGRDIAAAWPELLRVQDEENDGLKRQILPESFWQAESLREVESDLRRLILGQVALGTIVSDAVRKFGVEPTAVIGYSLGESAGLFSLRAWKDRDLMWKRVWESTLFTEEITGRCKAARKQLGLGDDDPFEWQVGVIDRRPEIIPGTYLLLVNTDREYVIGGDRRAVQKLVQMTGGNFVPLAGVTTVHCDLAEPVKEAYRDLHLLPTEPPPNVRFYSGAWGRSYELSRESAADSIVAGALGIIDYPKLIRQAYNDGVRLFVEMGPGNSCSRMIGQILEGKPHFAKAACPQTGSALTAISQVLAGLAAEGVAIDLDFVYGQEDLAPRAEVRSQDMVVIPIRGPELTIPPPPSPPSAAPTPRQQVNPVSEKTIAMPRTMPVAKRESVVAAVPSSGSSTLVRTSAATASAHEVFLRISSHSTQAMSALVAYQTELLSQMVQTGATFEAPLGPAVEPGPAAFAPVFMDRDQCMTFAIGRVGDVLGEAFAPIDEFPTRVRLPDEPLMLVDRILEVEGEPLSLSHGRVVTEHDVLVDGWYLDSGRIPTCIAVEAGQADLFLSGYLGIDLETRGLAVYRLLDAVVTFHRDLPVAGEVIRYDIKIERFFRQGKTYLFRFHFEGTVNGEPLLSMRDGCAGFFTEEELRAGKGIVQTELAQRPIPGKRPPDWRELVPMSRASFSDSQIDALRRGDLAGAFGPAFATLGLRHPLGLPSGRMKLLDRVTELDPTGGRFGLGLIRAEADIHPDDWFITCHFIDDQVMPGTLMYECCLHTLRVFLMRMGWVGEAEEVACQPVPGVASQLKCRGQVLATTKKATYEISIKEIGYQPEPYAIVDALMYADDKGIVEITNMSLRMTGLDRETLEQQWSALDSTVDITDSKKPPLYSYEQILAFAVGKPSEAFGDRYRIFDDERVIARLPGPPYQFLDRITAVRGEPWEMVAGAFAEGQYDVPCDAWYFEASRQPWMPFAVLLEVALQPCGWLAAYCGSALTSPVDVSFRNLGGSAVQYLPVGPDAGTLTMTATMTRVSSSGGMIIQNFDFEVRRGNDLVYAGDTYFGFFSKQALADQVGIRDAKRYLPSPEEVARASGQPYPSSPPYPAKMLRMIDEIETFLPHGGPKGLGFLRGTKQVDPEEWFFKAHFFQDPVCPGSLGLESFLQLVQFAGNERWGIEPDGGEPWFWHLAFDTKQRWSYRGQVIPANRLVTVEAWITAVDDATRTITADGFLLADGKPIYQMNDFSLRRLASPDTKQGKEAKR